MQDEPRYSTWSVATFSAWLGTAVLIIAAWMTWLIGHLPYVAILIAETACVASAVAAVLQIRCFGSRIARLIRVTNGLESPDADLREFPRR